MLKRPIRILFAGYAPVHFICFRPIYERLRKLPQFEFYFSGGLIMDRETDRKWYDTHGLYRKLKDVPRNRVLTLNQMRSRNFDMVFSAHTTGFFPRRRCARVQIFHGVSFRNLAIREDQRQHDYHFVIGPYMMRGFQRRRITRAQDPTMIPVGFPKLDRLVDGSLDREKILRRLNLKGDRPVLLYAPTGGKHNSMEICGEELVATIKKQNRYDLIVKPHDHPKHQIDWFHRLKKFEGPHVKLVRDLDIVPYLFAADLLISDASSAASEYTILDRPIIFMDVPKLLALVRRKGAMLDLKTYGRRTGITVRKPKDLPRVLRWFLAHPRYRSSVRRAMARDLFFDPGRATDRAIEWILWKLRHRMPQPSQIVPA